MVSQNLTISEWTPINHPTQNSEAISIDYFSFFTGVFVALLGVFLNILWEIYKSKKQEKNSITAIVNELKTNISVLADNKRIVLRELQIIESGKNVVIPVLELNHNFSSFLIINCPIIFKKQIELLEDVRKISKLTNSLNKTIQSRESYRINNGAMNNYNTRVKIYDEILRDLIVELEILLPSFISKLEAYIS